MAGKFEAGQSQIAALEKKVAGEEKAETLKQKLQANRKSFFDSVNSIKDDYQAAKSSLKDSNNISVINGMAQDINDNLGRAAITGERIYQTQLKGEKSGELYIISDSASFINNSVSEIEKSVPVLQSLEQADTALIKKGRPSIKEVDKLLIDKKLGPVEKRNKLIKLSNTAIDELAVSKQALKGIPHGAVPDILSDYHLIVLKEVDTGLKKMAQIKEYYAVRDFAESDKYKQYLIFDEETGQVKKTAAFKKLPTEEKQRILLELNYEKIKIADEIGEKCAITPEEKGYFKGKRLMAEGKYLEAKDLLMKYILKQRKDHVTRDVHTSVGDDGNPVVSRGPDKWGGTRSPEEKQYGEQAEGLLKQIALMEIGQARARFNALKEGMEAQWHSVVVGAGENTLGLNNTEAKIYLNHMEKTLNKAEQMVRSGKALNLKTVLNKLKTMKPGTNEQFLLTYQQGFANKRNNKRFGSTFDVLAAQQRLNKVRDPEKRREMALKEAKKAHDLGLFAMARMYYDQYFEPEFKEAKKKVKRSDIEAKMWSDSDLQQRMWNSESKIKEKIKEEFRKAHGKEIESYQLDSLARKQKNKMFQMAVSSAYNKAIKAEAHADFQGDKSLKGAEWNEMYSNTFFNLEYFEERNWYELWKFTEEEWDGFLTTLYVDIALLVVSMGMGNIAKMAVTRVALSQMARKGAARVVFQKGLEQATKGGFRTYCKFIVKEFGWKKAAALGLLSVGVESAVRTAGKYAAESVLEEGVSTGFEIGLMAASGEQLTNEKVRVMLRDNIVYAIGIPAGMAITSRAAAGPAPRKPSSADKKIYKANSKRVLAEAAKKIGVDFSKPKTIKTARVTPDGTVIINGKTLPKGELNVSLLAALPAKTRNKIIQLAPNNALDSHFQSKFSKEVPKALWPDPNNPESAKQVAGWVDKSGNIHFNLTHLNDGRVMRFKGETGSYRAKAGDKIMPEGYKCETNKAGDLVVRGPDGKIMKLRQFLKSAAGKKSKLMQTLKIIKAHESTHQAIELAFSKTETGPEGKPRRVEDPLKTKSLKSLFAKQDADGNVPKGKIPLFDQNGKPTEVNFQNIQEYLSHIADGSISIPIKLRNKLEGIITSHLPRVHGKNVKFTFNIGRNISTKLLATNPELAFKRAKEAAMQMAQAQVGSFNKGDQINLPGSKFDGYFIYGVMPNGILNVSAMDPKVIKGVENPAIMGRTVSLNDVLYGAKIGDSYVTSVMGDTVSLSHLDPKDPKNMRACQLCSHMTVGEALAGVIKKAPGEGKNILKKGDTVAILSSRGDRMYQGMEIVKIDGMTGEVTAQQPVGDKFATRRFDSMAQLREQVDFAAAVQKIPNDVDLINTSGQLDYGWTVSEIDPNSLSVTLQHKDGREFQVKSSDLSVMINNVKAYKKKIREYLAENLKHLPQTMDLMGPDGRVYKGWKVESVDYNTDEIRVKTADGRLWKKVKLEALLQENVQVRDWIRQQQAKKQVPGQFKGIRDAHGNIIPHAKRAPVPQARQRARVPAPKKPGLWKALKARISPNKPKVKIERNEVQLPPEQVPRSTDVLSVGDLHGNMKIFVDNLKDIGVISANANFKDLSSIKWTGGNKKLILHGDILADRNASSLDIMKSLRKLQAEAAKEGGQISLIAGNHEDFAIAFLAGRNHEGKSALEWCFPNEQGKGLLEFINKYSSDPKMQKADNFFQVMSYEGTNPVPPLHQEMLLNMRKDPEGRKLLEQMASMKLVEHINDTLYIHTELTPKIINALDTSRPTMGKSVDNINRIYQQGLRYMLLGEGSMPADFTAINDIFLGTSNRDYSHKPGALKGLNAKGINYVVHGHTSSKAGENVTNTSDGVAIINVDHSAGKGGGGQKPGEDLSVGRINKKDGQFTDK